MPRHVYNRPHKLRFGLVCHDCITTAEQDQLLREIFNTVSHDIETTEMTYLPEQSKFALLCEQVAGAFSHDLTISFGLNEAYPMSIST